MENSAIKDAKDTLDRLLHELQNPQDSSDQKKILNDTIRQINLFLQSASEDTAQALVQRIEQNGKEHAPLTDLLSGYVLSRSGQDTKGAEKLLKVINNDPEQPVPVYITLAKSQMNIGRLDEAEALYRQIESDEPVNAFIGLGRIAQKRQQYQKAAAWFQKALDKQPGHIAAISGLSTVFGHHQRNWQSALDYVQQGLAHHPDNLGFIELKAHYLIALNQYEKATAFLEKAIADHPHHRPFQIARIKCHQAVFDFRAAEHDIRALRERDPSDAGLAILQAENLYHLGRLSEIHPVLNAIDYHAPALSPELAKRMDEIRVRASVDHNELETLIQKPDVKAGKSRVVSDTIIRHFVNQSNFDKALATLSRLRDKKPESRHDVHDQILNLFNMQRVRNIIEYAGMNARAHKQRLKADSFGILGLSDILEQLERYDHLRPHESWYAAFGLLAFIKAKYRHTYFNTYESPDQTALIAHKIRTHIRQKRPLSLIRLGDFEGMYLGYGKDRASFETKDRLEAQRIYWGKPYFTMAEWNTQLKDRYWAAIRNADIIGVLGPHRLCRELAAFGKPHWILRGIVAALENVVSNRLHTTETAANHWIVSAHIHQHFDSWGGYAFIFKNLRQCSVISCHTGLAPILKKHYGVKVKDYYNVEPEFKHAQKFGYDSSSRKHYPDQYQSIMESLSTVRPGDVFLVGAGLLGKIYCDAVRERGGIAIDVGSMMDTWIGQKTRVCTDFSEYYDCSKTFERLKSCLSR